MGRLDEVDLSLALSRKEEEHELSVAWRRLTQLRLTLGGLIGAQQLGPPVLVLFEGWDASGKGGAIKRLVTPLDARHVRVVQFAAPSLAEEGAIIVKLWLHISEAEQLKRFEQRAGDPLKAWKLTEDDWSNRAKRPEYEEAVEDMIGRTDQPRAPWHLIA